MKVLKKDIGRIVIYLPLSMKVILTAIEEDTGIIWYKHCATGTISNIDVEDLNNWDYEI